MCHWFGIAENALLRQCWPDHSIANRFSVLSQSSSLDKTAQMTRSAVR